MIIKTARKKLAELPIVWDEGYKDRNAFFKEQYEAVIGEGSYFRWNGKNTKTGDEYYVVVSPAHIHKPEPRWYAGVRKLPDTYSSYGEYFDSIDDAFKHAHETWGTPIPSDTKHYTSKDLKNLKKRCDEWKEERDKEEEKEKKEKKASLKYKIEKVGFARRVGDTGWQSRAGNYTWINLDALNAGRDPDTKNFNNIVAQERGSTPEGKRTPIEKAYDSAKRERRDWVQRIAQKYGLMDPCFYQIWIAHDPAGGTQSSYIWTVGPHGSFGDWGNSITDEGDAYHHFDYFKRAVSTGNEEQLASSIAKGMNKQLGKLQDAYSQFGIDFNQDDLAIPTVQELEESTGTTAIQLNDQGRAKLAGGILDWYKNNPEILNRAGVSLEDIQARMERNPEHGWKEELRKISVIAYQKWHDDYTALKNKASETLTPEEIEALEFLETGEPPVLNEKKMKTKVGSGRSGPSNIGYTYKLSKAGKLDKPDVLNRDTLFLDDVGDIEVGDKIGLIGKVSTDETYSSGRKKRKSVKKNIEAEVVAVDQANNSIQLAEPIQYDENEFTRDQNLTWEALSVNKDGNVYKKSNKHETLQEAMNAFLSKTENADITVPEFSSDVPSSYLKACMEAKRRNQAPPPVPTQIVSSEVVNVEEGEVVSADSTSENEQQEENHENHEDYVEPDFAEQMGGKGHLSEDINDPVENEEEDWEGMFNDPMQPLASAVGGMIKMAKYFDKKNQPEKAEKIRTILKDARK